MALDEGFDKRTERQHCETSCAGVFEREPDQPVTKSATLDALVDLGVDERNQTGPRPVGREANHLAVNRKLVALTIGCVGYLDALWRSHARQIRAQTTDVLALRGEGSRLAASTDALALVSNGPRDG